MLYLLALSACTWKKHEFPWPPKGDRHLREGHLLRRPICLFGAPCGPSDSAHFSKRPPPRPPRGPPEAAFFGASGEKCEYSWNTARRRPEACRAFEASSPGHQKWQTLHHFQPFRLRAPVWSFREKSAFPRERHFIEKERDTKRDKFTFYECLNLHSMIV